MLTRSAIVPAAVVALVLAATSAPASTPAPLASPAGARSRQFTGAVTHASHAFAADRDRRVVVVMTPSGHPVAPGTSVTVGLGITMGCTKRARCHQLSGRTRARATLVAHFLPDLPPQAALAGSIHLGNNGTLVLSGTATGTGFVRIGRFTLSLLLRSARGTLTIDAHSQYAPGFNSPF